MNSRSLKYTIIIWFLFINALGQKLTREQKIEVEALTKKIWNESTFNHPPNYQNIINLINQISGIDTLNSEVFAWRAKVNSEVGEFKSALDNYDKFLKGRTNSIVFIDRAKVKAQLGDELGAIKDVDLAMKHYGSDPIALSGAGYVYLLLKNIKMAEYYYDKCTSLNPRKGGFDNLTIARIRIMYLRLLL